MQIPQQLRDWHPELTAWRRELHQHPQTAFEETFASDFIAQRLRAMGIACHQGLAKTGVVGTLQGRGAPTGQMQSIGLRADIDALDIHELTGLPYASIYPGKMHACGHDGHTTMLLGAARYLAETRNFSGTVQFIFQPAEENEGGGRVMVEEGLFDQFPCQAVFGMHNWPGLPVGTFGVAPGPLMASFDVFEILISGRGSHAAKPHESIDPVVVAAQLVTALQTIVSRQTNPLDQIVLTITQIHAGDTWNVIPATAMLRGTVRTFRPEVQDAAQASMARIAEHVTAAWGATAKLDYQRRYPATINTVTEAEWSARAATAIVGSENVTLQPDPSMGSEDFAFMLQKRPGCYLFAGNGPSTGERLLHNPHYDFNDDLLPVGAAYWSKLVEQVLPATA